MTHIHSRFKFIQGVVFRKLLTTSAIKRDVDPSDVGTKGLRRERFCRIRALVGVGNEVTETRSRDIWDDESCKSNVCQVLRVKMCRLFV